MDDPGIGDPGDGSVGRTDSRGDVRRIALAWAWGILPLVPRLRRPDLPNRVRVSVLDVLKRIGIPRGLQATVAGESLFNDGIGWSSCSRWPCRWRPEIRSTASARPRSRACSCCKPVGGGLLGLGSGYLTLLLVRRVDDYNVELIISLALASGTYSAAGLLGVSGPIAVVVAGIIIGSQGMDGAMRETTRQHLMTFWRLVEEILNALLFLTIGLEIASIDLDVRSIIAAAAMIPVALVIRWFSVAVSALPLNLRLPHRYGGLLVLTWGGLRGGLSVAMALSLPDGPTKGPILTVAHGIVVFSIVVQGLTLERVARRALSGRVDALSR